MPLIIEDGSGVPGANTYLDVASARALAAELGVALPDSDDAVAASLRKGAFRVDNGKNYGGFPVGGMEFPRRGLVDTSGRSWPEDAVPDPVLVAQLLYAVEDIRAPIDRGDAAYRIASRTETAGDNTSTLTFAAGHLLAGRSGLVPVPLADEILDTFVPSLDAVLAVRVPQPLNALRWW